ncbi:MAG: GT2 family glycosyltransferase [bacterium]|jgi:GT2 family glycosyltransferase
MKASLIIPSYNREELLVQTIQCGIKQNYSDYEVIVIDQTKNHLPATSQFIEENQQKIQYIFSDQPSVTKARNLGIKHATGEVLIFIDDDTSFDENFIANHVDAHKRGSDMVQGRILEKGCRISKKPTWIASYIKFKGKDTCDHDGKTNNVTGCNFSVAKKVIDQIGTFDESFYGMAIREDSDFGYRAYKAGFNVTFSVTAELFHHRSPSGGVDSGIKVPLLDRSYYFGELLFSRKNFGSTTVFWYRFRIFLRGVKVLWRLILRADQDVKDLLETREQKQLSKK